MFLYLFLTSTGLRRKKWQDFYHSGLLKVCAWSGAQKYHLEIEYYIVNLGNDLMAEHTRVLMIRSLQTG